MTTSQIPFIFNKQIVIYRPWAHAPALSTFCLRESTGLHLLHCLVAVLQGHIFGAVMILARILGLQHLLSKPQALRASGFALDAPELLMLGGNLI